MFKRMMRKEQGAMKQARREQGDDTEFSERNRLLESKSVWDVRREREKVPDIDTIMFCC